MPIRFALRLKFMLLKTVENEAPPRISLTGELASMALLWTGEMPWEFTPETKSSLLWLIYWGISEADQFSGG